MSEDIKGTNQAGITIAQYNALWKQYCIDQNESNAARVAGVNSKTARRYISGEGNPDKGMYPIKERFKQRQEESQRQEDLTFTQWQQLEVKGLQRFKGVMVAELELLGEHVKQRMKRYRDALEKDEASLPELSVGIDKLTKSMEQILRLEHHMRGGSESTSTIQSSKFAGWSEEEIENFISNGIYPEHLR